MSKSSIWPIDGTLPGATTLDQNLPGSKDNKRVLHIPQSSKTGASPSNGLRSHQDTLRGSDPFVEMYSIYLFKNETMLCDFIYQKQK